MKNKTIRLVVFNEEYWNKGLIYTQNILPLIKLAEATKCQIEIISFTSIIKGFSNRHQIKKTKKELDKLNIYIKDYPVLYYPTRLLFTRWFLLPYLFLNTVFYIIYLRIKDMNKEVIYNLRSYPIALCFYKFYGNYHKLVFDPRTDWIEEAVNSGFFKSGDINERLWRTYEGRIMNSFDKTIYISDIFLKNSIANHPDLDQSKLAILYNPIDYQKFGIPHVEHSEIVFLYTGSFGKWNKLENYLDFILFINDNNPDIKFLICTSSSRDYVDGIINLNKYVDIKKKVYVFYNVSIEDLPTYYAHCDFGLQLMHKKDSRIGVKYIEYIAAGITPIVNENVQGAAYLSKKYNVGIVISSSDTQSTIYEKIINTPRIDTESPSYKEIKSLSDLNSIVSKLISIYLK